MAWVAGKEQTIKRDGAYVVVKPGDSVPEAEFWPNRNAWMRQGYIREVATDPTQSKAAVELIEKAKAAARAAAAEARDKAQPTLPGASAPATEAPEIVAPPIPAPVVVTAQVSKKTVRKKSTKKG